METRITIFTKLMVLVALFCATSIVKSQPAWFKFQRQTFSLHSGVHDGVRDSLGQSVPVFKGTVQIANVPWLKLYFGDCELGQDSYVKITSLEDGGYQFLNAISLKQWYNTSAYFNGNAVEVELYVDPEDKGVFFELVEVVAGDRLSSIGKSGKATQVTSDPCSGWLGICGGFDDRVASNDPAIGRISGIRAATGDSGTIGTGWIASNGAYITAGHIFDDGGFNHSEFLEFNVPASDPDGIPNYAHPNNQYAIDSSSSVWENDACSRDWAVYRCFPNSNTGLLPVQAQNAFYRLSLDSTPPTIRVTGFGLDECLPGTTGGRNSNSNTQQTHAGPNNNSPTFGDIGSGNYVYWSFAVDIRNGNSGSPIIPDGTSLSVGIQTCGSFSCANSGTSFDCDALENAVNVFPGANIRYADNGHPFATGSGTIFRPYATVAGAVAAVPAGGIISIVQGSYNESMTINKAMSISAPVGNVTIGPTPSPKIAGNDSDPKGDYESVSRDFSLSQNYPNPFNPETTIEYTLPKPTFVKLKIFDVLGQEVKTLVNELQQSGVRSVVWDGKNNQGQLVPSGLYIYQIVADGFIQSSKSMLLK